MPDIEVIFDFGSPNAYLVHKVLPGLAAEVGVKVSYSPVLLGGIFKLTNNTAPMVAFAKVDNKLRYERLEFNRFVAHHGLSDFKWTPHFPVYSVGLMRGALAAQEEGTLTAYIDAGLKATWEDGAKMADPQECAAALTRHGVDGAHYMARALEPELKQQLITKTEAAVARGVFGIPTFFVGDEMFFGKERFDQVIAAARG